MVFIEIIHELGEYKSMHIVHVHVLVQSMAENIHHVWDTRNHAIATPNQIRNMHRAKFCTESLSNECCPGHDAFTHQMIIKKIIYSIQLISMHFARDFEMCKCLYSSIYSNNSNRIASHRIGNWYLESTAFACIWIIQFVQQLGICLPIDAFYLCQN